MSNLNRPPITIDRRPIDAKKLKLILMGTWHSDLRDVKISQFTTLKYKRLALIEEILQSLKIGSRELAQGFLTKPYSLKIEGPMAREFGYLILVLIILPL